MRRIAVDGMRYVIAASVLAVAVAGAIAAAQWARLFHVPASASPAPPAAFIPDPEDAAEFEQAVSQFRAAHWASAYGRLAVLADRGHPEAARIALFMVRYGRELYGSPWSASQEQIDTWVYVAARAPASGDFSGGD